jgi:hypothetical protein
MLGRIGPITAAQARELARMGTRHHATVWRVILASPDGIAIGVARLPRPRLPGRARPRGSADGPQADPPRSGLAPTVGRVTVIVPAATPARALDSGDLPVPADLLRACARVAAAARRAGGAARAEAEADQHAPGGCAHVTASPAYRPPPRIAELVTARDQTCRNPRCNQPAWRADLDHTRPHHLGGLTCKCNLGGACRGDHQLKQLPGWSLTQPEPGVFVWTTPAGRVYTARPDRHHAS